MDNSVVLLKYTWHSSLLGHFFSIVRLMQAHFYTCSTLQQYRFDWQLHALTFGSVERLLKGPSRQKEERMSLMCSPEGSLFSFSRSSKLPQTNFWGAFSLQHFRARSKAKLRAVSSQPREALWPLFVVYFCIGHTCVWAYSLFHYIFGLTGHTIPRTPWKKVGTLKPY